MIVKRLFWVTGSNILYVKPKYTLISKLFRKKKQEASKPKEKQDQATKNKQKDIEVEDQQYNFFERHQEIDTSFDFLKLKQQNTDIIPENLGAGGLQQVLYWSQIAKSPQQIHSVLMAFNRTATANPRQVPLIISNVQLSQFKASLVSKVYIANSLYLLRQYALFGYKFEIDLPEFWQKVEYKSIRIFPKTSQEKAQLVDICFLMSQLKQGQDIYNQVQKLLGEDILTVDQQVKLFLAFSALHRGQKLWIQKLVQGLTRDMHLLDAQQLTAILPILKDVKKTPPQLNPNIIARAQILMNTFTLNQLLSLTDFLGFATQNPTLWKSIEERADVLLKGKKIGFNLYQQLILKGMLTYRLSLDFIRRYIISPLHDKGNDLIIKLRPQTLSALAKGFYIYELEQQTKQFTQPIGQSVISKITQGINEISDDQLIQVIKDYNLTRHGHRQLYIFLQQVIKVRYINSYNAEIDRNIVEKLISIYENSGMCSQQMFTSLKNLIMQ